MTTVYIPRTASRALVTNRWFRNGKYPDASAQSALARAVNHAARWLTKEPFAWGCPLDAIPAAIATGTQRDRWRFAWRSGPYVKYLRVRFICGPAPEDLTGVVTDPPSVCLTVTNGAGSTIGTAEFNCGFNNGTDVPANFGHASLMLTSAGAPVALTANTEYFGLVEDRGRARIAAISVYEESLPSDTANGYTAPSSVGSPILDADRASVATMARAMWKQGGAHLLNWNVDVQSAPRTTTSATEANLIDTTLTGVNAYGAAAPQFVLDLSNRTRVSAFGVPVVVKVYASKGTSDGTVYLMSDSGDTLATVTITGAAAWYSTAASLNSTLWGDATNAPVHLTFKSAGRTCSVYAVSVYRYEA